MALEKNELFKLAKTVAKAIVNAKGSAVSISTLPDNIPYNLFASSCSILRSCAHLAALASFLALRSAKNPS